MSSGGSATENGIVDNYLPNILVTESVRLNFTLCFGALCSSTVIVYLPICVFGQLFPNYKKKQTLGLLKNGQEGG